MKKTFFIAGMILIFTNLVISQSEWIIDEKLDKMTDEVACGLRLISVEGKSATFKIPCLGIQFQDNEVIFVMVFNSLSINQNTVLVRFGKNPAYEEKVIIDIYSSYINVYCIFKNSKEMVFKSMNQNNLVVKVKKASGDYEVCEFNISGLYDALKKAAQKDPNFQKLLDDYEEYKNQNEEQ